jgi:glycosyltransferase involved in cell wall biosynthesis
LLLFYQAALLFVYPSKAEGFGIPPLEAAAARTPVVCSNTSAMQEFDFFGPGHVDPEDYDGYKTAVAQILEEAPGMEALTDIAATISKRYSWDKTASVLHELILAHAKATGGAA